MRKDQEQSHSNQEQGNAKKDDIANDNLTKNGINEKITKTEIKNAHASGIGTLERSENNKIDPAKKNNSEENEAAY